MDSFDHVYGRPPGRPGVRTLRRTADVRLGPEPQHAAQAPALRSAARLHIHLHGLETPIYEICGLETSPSYLFQ